MHTIVKKNITTEEELVLISEIEQKIEQYKNAQEYQLQHGGPGPVADEEIMKIVNEHNSIFSVIVERDEVTE